MLLVIGVVLAVALGALLLVVGPAADTVTLLPGFTQAQVATSLQGPTNMAFAPEGRIFINEEGENAWEKNNRGEAGANSGWPYCEGPNRFGRGPAAELLAGRPNLLLQPRGPFRDHGCAITAGAFYTPQQGQFPSVYPECYFFADVCNGWIRGYDIADDSASELATGVEFSVDLDVSEDGYLFYLSRRTGGTTTASGAITRVSYPAP